MIVTKIKPNRQSTMPREAEPSLSEKTFLSKALEQGYRLDNRKFEQFRKLDLTFGDEYGVVDVKLGKTRYTSWSSCWLKWLIQLIEYWQRSPQR